MATEDAHPEYSHPRDIPSLEAMRASLRETMVAQDETQAEPTESAMPVEADEAIGELASLDLEERELKHALAHDFHRYFPAPESLEARKEAPRTETGLPLSGTSRRPDWEQYFPAKGDDEGKQKYDELLAALPEPMQVNLEALRGITARKQEFLADPAVKEAYEKQQDERVTVLKEAGIVRGAERLVRQSADEATRIKALARRNGRHITAAEREYLGSLSEQAARLQEAVAPYREKPEVVAELRRRDAIDDARALEAGFLETDSMREIITRTVPALSEGKPLLLFGETGGAKTALARHLAEKYLVGDYEFISGHAEVNAYQVMGKAGLKGRDGMTETVFDPGPLYTAMEQGRPIILDEIDAMPASFLIRLNDILQRRPGDTMRIQEDANHEIRIKEGFCIVATANMKSGRYQREELDTALMQRFRHGAGIEHVTYPDADVKEGEFPLENYRLAVALLTDGQGRITLPPGVDRQTMVNYLKASHYSQRMFTNPAAEVGSDFVDSAQAGMAKPALDRAVLAPREWMGVLSQVVSTDGELTLEKALSKFVAGQTVPKDRQVLAKLLASHELLPTATESDLRVAPGTLRGLRNGQ